MNAAPGSHIVVLGDDETGIALRCDGWCIRDTCTIVTPSTVVVAYLARQPFSGTVVENVLLRQTGVINVDGCRVSADATYLMNPNVGKGRGYAETANHGIYHAGKGGVVAKPHTNGRWPSNVLLVHASECRREGVRRVKGSPTSKKFHAAYEGQSVTGFLGGWSHPGNQHSDADGKETVEQWACSEHCPSRLLDAMVGNSVDAAGVSRFYPQFPHLLDAMGWLVQLGCPP
jgi:hypothetical protein